MAIIHEAHLFKPNNFAEDVLPLVKMLKEDNVHGQQVLHRTVLKLFEQSTRVQTHALDAGWDIWSINKEAESEELDSPQQIAKWIVFLIYNHLDAGDTASTKLGLLGEWRLMDNILRVLHWHDSDSALLIHGHSFGYFAQLWIASEVGRNGYQGGDLQYWEYIRPVTTHAQIGWLDYVDVKRLLSKLLNDEPQVASMNLPDARIAAGGASENITQRTYQAALQILTAANEAQSGLCLITSG